MIPNAPISVAPRRSIRNYQSPPGIRIWAFLLAVTALLGPGLAAATTTINHQFLPATIAPGDVPRYRITIANDALVPLTDAKVTSLLFLLPALPSGTITIAPTPGVADTCGFTGVTANAGESKVVLTGGTIPAKVGGVDGQCAFELSVTSTTPGNHVITIPANTPPDADTAGYEALENAVTVRNGTLANATLAILTLQNPTGSKLFSPSPAVTGDPTTLTATLSNPNAGHTIPLTSFTDTLPGNMVVATPANASVSCNGTGAVNGAVTAVPGTQTVTLTGGTIGQGGSCVLSVRVLAPSIVGASQVFTNSLADGAIGNTRGLTSPAFSRDLTVNSPVTVSKSFNPTTIPSGQPSLMTLVVGNNSTANTLAVTSFVDDLAGTTLTVVDLANGAPADPAVVCDGAGAVNGILTDAADAALVQGSTSIKLAGAVAGQRSGANGKCTITAYVTSTTDGPHTNLIPADAVLNPAGHASPGASATLTANAQLTVNKTVSVNQVAPGQWTEFTVTINNWSGADVNNVTFRDVLPNNGVNQMVLDGSAGIPVSAVGCTGFAWVGADGDSELVGTGGTVAGGVGSSPGVCTIVFRARLPMTATTGLTFNNQVPTFDDTVVGVPLGVGGDGNGPGGRVVNPTASPAANTTTVDSIALSKSFSPNPIAQGQLSTLTLVVRNRVLSTVTAVNLTDNLPAGLTLAANPAATNTCGGSLQAFPGSGQLVLTGGSVGPRPGGSLEQTCTITARVTGAAVGSYVNTINPANLTTSVGSIPNPVADTLSVTAGISGSKSFNPTATAPGGTSRVTVHIVNQSSGQLTNVTLNDDGFSAGLAVANPANAATSCGGSPTIVANPGATSVRLEGVTLPAGAGCDLSFDLVTSGAGPWSNSIAPGRITSAEGPSNSAAISANLAAATAAISINKAFSPVIVTGGMPSVLTIDVINSSGISIHGAGFTDTFPTGIQVYPVPDASTNCAGGTVSAVPGDGKVSLVGATLAPSSVCQVYVTVTSIKFLNLTNFIPAAAITSTEGYTNALGTTATLSTLQGLGVMKGFDPAYIAPNQVSRLKIRLVSTFDPNAVSPVTLTGISFTDPLPAGLVFAPAPNASTTCAGASLNVNTGTQALTLFGGNLLPGTVCNLEVDVTTPTLGIYNNVIPQHEIVTDQGITNEEPGVADLTVVDLPLLAKAFSPAQVRVGERSTLTVTVNNNAGVPLTGVSLTDTLPTGVTVFATPNASTTCAGGVVTAVPGDDRIRLTGATVPAGGSCTFRADVAASVAGARTNTIGAGAILSDQGLTNPGPASANLTTLEPPTVAKVFAPASIASGGTSTLTISLGNANAGDITLTSALVDALPGNVFVAAVPNVLTTCPGAVTATPGGISISYANGAIIPAGGCTLSVDVTSSVSGDYVNTIAAGQLQTSAGTNPTPAVATLGVDKPARPTVSKAFSPTTIDLGGVSTLTIGLGNPNAGALTLTADLVDTLPANLEVANPANVGGTCTVGSVTATPGAATVTYANGATIPPGGCTITVAVTSNLAGSYNNQIPADALSTDAGTNPQPANAGLVVRAPTTPTLVKSFSPGIINPGAVSRLTISLGNANAAAATLAVDLVDTLPAGVVIAPAPNVGGTCPGAVTAVAGTDTVIYAAGAQIPSGGCTIGVDVTSSVSGGPYVNTVPAGALQTNLGNNGAPATANLFVNPPQPPSISKSFSPTTILRRSTSTLSVSLGNGNAVATSLTADLVDTLPAGVVVAAVPNIRVSAGCDLGRVVAVAGGGTVTYQNGGSIPANGGCAIAVDVTSDVLGIHSNSIPIGALQTGIGTNAVATQANLTVIPIPPTVAKSFSPPGIFPGGISTLTLVLGNADPGMATLTSDLVDTLPINLMLAANPNIRVFSGCVLGSVVAVAGGSTIRYLSGGTIPGSGGCSIAVDVTSSVMGVYTNTVAAGALSATIGGVPVVNGQPANAQLSVVAPGIPAAPQWALMAMAGLLALSAGVRLRRGPV